MIFSKTSLAGVLCVDVQRREDQRGSFARTFCQHEFAAHGLPINFVQSNISVNTRRGILRGMHFQAEPHAEGKLVRCTRGAIWDVVVDLRSGSPSHHQWIGVELTELNARALYIPEGCAHGFQTLIDNSEVLYLMSEFYYPELARGVRWNDPAFGIKWPIADAILSERDASYPDVADD